MNKPLTAQYPPPISSPGWSTRTKRTVLIALVVLIALMVWRLNEILPLLIVSLILAYLFYPATSFLERRVTRWLPAPRNWAIFLTIVAAISTFVVVILVVFPALFAQLEEFGNRLPRLVANLQSSAEEFLSHPIIINNQTLTIDGQPLIPLEQLRLLNGGEDVNWAQQIRELNLVEFVRGFINSLTGPAVNVVGGALTFAINAIFTLTLLFYWMKDGGHFVHTLIEFTPVTYRNDVTRLFYELARVWDAYLRGQLFLASFVGVVVLICAAVLGIPNAPTLGLISGVMEFIPTLGPLIAIVPAILLAVSSTSSTLPFLGGLPFALVVIIVWITIQNVNAIIVAPRVMGSRLNLHPVVVIIGVIAGASLAGAFGIILAAPTVATLRLLGQYIYGKLTDTPPFPAQPRHVVGESKLPIVDPVLALVRRVIQAASRWWRERANRKPVVE